MNRATARCDWFLSPDLKQCVGFAERILDTGAFRGAYCKLHYDVLVARNALSDTHAEFQRLAVEWAESGEFHLRHDPKVCRQCGISLRLRRVHDESVVLAERLKPYLG